MRIVTIMIICFAIILSAFTDAMPVSSDNQETSTASSIPTTTIQNDSDKKPTTEDSVVTTTALSSGSDDDHNKKNIIYLEEIYAEPADILVVAEQRRFRFPYRRRFLQRPKEDDDEFPALF